MWLKWGRRLPDLQIKLGISQGFCSREDRTLTRLLGWHRERGVRDSVNQDLTGVGQPGD